MPNVHCFTSINFAYLNKARILCWSLKQYHPDWTFWVCINDKPPQHFVLDLSMEIFDKILWVEDLDINNVKSWIFKHDIIELCTAVKGPILSHISRTDADIIIYFDPDIAIFSSLSSIIDELQTNDILLTPHQLKPDLERQAIIDNEISSLKHGIYNLGFVAIRNEGEGKKFSSWWSERLLSFCYNDIPSGLFVDQRWCDHVPALFDNVKILKDPGLNVASWNLSQRKIHIDLSGNILVNGFTLKFFHFTKIETVGDQMLKKYSNGNLFIDEICAWYKFMLKKFSSPELVNIPWHYNYFENNVSIQRSHRLLYRSRIDLQNAFPNPLLCENESYFNWIKQNPSELIAYN